MLAATGSMATVTEGAIDPSVGWPLLADIMHEGRARVPIPHAQPGSKAPVPDKIEKESPEGPTDQLTFYC